MLSFRQRAAAVRLGSRSRSLVYYYGWLAGKGRGRYKDQGQATPKAGWTCTSRKLTGRAARELTSSWWNLLQ